MDVTVVQEPDVATALVFRTTAAGRSDLVVVGPRTHGSYHPGKALPVCIRLRLRPGWARAVLGRPVSELVDRAVLLGDLWGPVAGRLTSSLAAVGADAGAAAELLRAALRERAPGGDPLVAAAARELSEQARLTEVAARLGVSERHLRNVFEREVGLSPKRFARITRVRKVLSLAGRRGWSAVASDAGFFDQAHMIADFRAMMGVPPGAYLSGRLPPVTPCTDLTPLAGFRAA